VNLLALLAVLADVPQYDVFELSLTSSKAYANPFLDTAVKATFTSPSGRNLTAHGFHDGERSWRVRFAPEEVGVWSYRTTADDPELHDKAGSFTCTASKRPGFIRPDKARKYWFSFSDGSPFFGMGDTCYGLVNGIGDAQRKTYLDTRSSQKFNFVRFFAAGYPFNACRELAEQPDVWPWGGTAAAPDYDRLNPRFFRRLEKVLDELRARGMRAEVLVFNMYSKPFTDPALWTERRQSLWARHVVSSFAADPTVFLWTVTNEYETYPEGKYKYHPSDDAWAKRMGTLFQEADPHRHPTTVHPMGVMEGGLVRAQGPLFGKGSEIDVLTHQQNTYDTGRWLSDAAPGYWDGPAEFLDRDLRADRVYAKPVINTENGYEWLKDYPTNFTRQGHGTGKCRRAAWRVFMAGGAAYAAGFHGTWHGRDGTWWRCWKTGKTEAAPFRVADMGLAAHLGHYYDFIMKTDFRAMDPAQDLVNAPHLCLANRGTEYVIYAPSGGTVRVDLSSAEGAMNASWLDPRTAVTRTSGSTPAGAARTFEAPDAADWVLHLTRSEPIRVEAPADGGWPRNPQKIIRNGPRDFTVDPDGHDRYVMVEVVNTGTETQEVALRGFISNFGRKRDNTVSAEQYLYVKPPEGPWKRVYRQGTEMAYPYGPLILRAPPGRTRVGTVVNFTYREYAEYVESLSDPRLSKDTILTSGGGKFKVYRVRITQPGGAKKLRIAFCKTAHAYEQSGFYMAQGIVSWLLSGDPAANLDRVEWTIYPCLDPQAVHDGQNYIEYASLRLDDGRPQGDVRDNSGALWDPRAGEIPSQRFHVLADEHMFEMRDFESYKYNDPFAPAGAAGNGKSQVEAVMLGFWPYWYEFGIDAYDHENKRGASNTKPENFGGALVTHLEIPYYAKDDIDPRDRLREQGRMWARSHSQAFLRMQRDRNYWTEKSPGGPVDTSGAVFLPVPKVTLLETLSPVSGEARNRANGDGGTMRLYREDYAHGIGMKAGGPVVYAIPSGAHTFRAMAGVDDAERSADAAMVFIARVDGKEAWRSRGLARGERQMAYFGVHGGKELTLAAEGQIGASANWGGAKFTRDDPESTTPSRR